MHFALIGDHPDGRAFAVAAIAAGHALFAYCGSEPAAARQLNSAVKITNDMEEVLADPQVQAVIVAVPVEKRLDAARRALQSERHAIIAHPVDVKPNGGYELNMLQGDVHQVLLPLLPDAFVELTLPETEWLELTITDPKEPLLHLDDTRRHPAFPGWTLIRRVAGEVQEVSAFGIDDFAQPGGVVLCNGRAERCLFHIKCHRAGERRQVGLRFVTVNGETHYDMLEVGGAWPKMVAAFDRAVARLVETPRSEPAAGAREEPDAKISWRDEIRALELNDAAARSLAKRRSVLMEYQEASEEVGFKGTMTLIGCGMLWLVILLLVLSAWQPWLGWLILPAIVLFLGLQFLAVFAKRI
jgi:Oxidoreductase family, NAD-binding Rossmann fold